MSWHYLQGEEEASWEGCSLDGAPDALLRSIPTQGGCSSLDSGTTSLIPFPSGMTCVPSTESRGEAQSTSLQEDFPARTSAQQARGQESPESVVACGENLPASFAKWDPDTSSWRTHQYSLLGGLESFSETWPRWGMMRGGESFQLPTPSGLLALRAWITSESESGSSLPTPQASDNRDRGNLDNPSIQRRIALGKQLNLSMVVKRLPSIRKSDSERGGRGDLIQAVRGNPNKHWARLQTPTVQDANGRDRHNQRDGSVILSLLGECRRMPTVVSTSKSGGWCGLDGGSHARATMTEQEIKELTGGSLNPEWTEWFMGWPIGWTDLAPLGTGRLRQWFDSHGIS